MNNFEENYFKDIQCKITPAGNKYKVVQDKIYLCATNNDKVAIIDNTDKIKKYVFNKKWHYDDNESVKYFRHSNTTSEKLIEGKTKIALHEAIMKTNIGENEFNKIKEYNKKLKSKKNEEYVLQIDHIDNDRTNNLFSNLNYITSDANKKKKYKDLLFPYTHILNMVEVNSKYFYIWLILKVNTYEQYFIYDNINNFLEDYSKVKSNMTIEELDNLFNAMLYKGKNNCLEGYFFELNKYNLLPNEILNSNKFHINKIEGGGYIVVPKIQGIQKMKVDNITSHKPKINMEYLKVRGILKSLDKYGK